MQIDLSVLIIAKDMHFSTIMQIIGRSANHTDKKRVYHTVRNCQIWE